MDTEASLQEYLRLNLRVPGDRPHRAAGARCSTSSRPRRPGVKEILTIGKIAWEVREAIEGRADFDLVIVDAAATGHIVAQLGAADAIRELVDVGPLRSQTQWVSELLADPAITAVNVVTTPEEMPVAETIELVGRLRTRGQRPARQRHRQPRAARAVHARRRGDVRGVARAGAAASVDRTGRPRRHRRARRGARSRSRCAARVRPTSSTCSSRSTCRCCTCRTCSCARTACA